MAEVHIPFQFYFRPSMLEGRKTTTARTKRYGDVGDTFSAFGRRFRIVSVREVPLKVVAEGWEKEGVASSYHFIRVWEELHPITGYRPEQIVFLHEFELEGSVDTERVPTESERDIVLLP